MTEKSISINLISQMLRTSQGIVELLARRYPDVLFQVNTKEKLVTLTIDDGPHPDVTPRILDTLALYKVRVNFFMLGSRVQGNEEILRRVVAEGHEIGNHMYEDSRSITLTPSEFEDQLEKTHSLLSQFAPVKWFRPGSGFFNRKMLDRVAERGYRLVLGSVYPYDAQLGSASFSSWYIRSTVRPGSIIVLHDGSHERARIISVLQTILPLLQGEGYRFVTLSELVASA